MDDVEVIQVSLGTDTVKAGVCGDDAPRLVMPSMVTERVGNQQPGIVYPDPAHPHVVPEGIPLMHRQRVDSWDGAKMMIESCYQQMDIPIRGGSCLMPVGIQTTLSDVAELCRIGLEDLSLSSMAFSMESSLALYGNGRCTGLCVDIGHGGTQISSIYEGYKVCRDVWLPIGGLSVQDAYYQDLYPMAEDARVRTDYRKMREGAYRVNPQSSGNHHPNNHGNVSFCLAEDNTPTLAGTGPTLPMEVAYSDIFRPSRSLPDGVQVIDEWAVRQAGHTAAETLFAPHVDSQGVSQAVLDVLSRSDYDCKRDLLRNIVLVGGCTRVEGVPARIGHDVGAVYTKAEVKVVASTERQYSTWVGGSIEGSLTSFEGRCITRAAYEEQGERLLIEKCPQFNEPDGSGNR
ncbi:actin family protein [Kipferlia bialata]|uniref:Actin family protein n=1 Tax=Kipferlia bialata TaxID=797122 RepID=A0A9K3GHY2_9EUKA|nr:actin family protein [Kipferlia bialata]GIQ83313.1 actin family protein [Kipferlia bialata]GIQ85668.1 actin family protein [Kipferlia bialata]|eukprot:g4183.t1